MKKILVVVLLVVGLISSSSVMAHDNYYSNYNDTNYLLYSIHRAMNNDDLLIAYRQSKDLQRMIKRKLEGDNGYCHGQTPEYYERKYDENEWEIEDLFFELEYQFGNKHRSREIFYYNKYGEQVKIEIRREIEMRYENGNSYIIINTNNY